MWSRTCLFFLNISIILITTVAEFRIVCYYFNRSASKLAKPEELNATLCTHIIYAFIRVNNSGNLIVDNEILDIDQDLYKRVVALKENNKNLKVLLGVGHTSVEIFSQVAECPLKRKTFAKSARSYLEHFHFDGLDLDWEKPYRKDRENFISLVSDVRLEFRNSDWLLTAAVSAIPSDGYDVPALNNLLDFINLMSYDFYGPWSAYTGQNSALFESSIESAYEKKNLNTAAAAKNWIQAGAELNKLVVGVAFYGRSFTLQNVTNFGVHAPIVGAGTVKTPSYQLIYEKYDDWSDIWDDEQKMPIKHKGDQWLGFDNEQSITLKVNQMHHILEENYGGVMIWQIALDDVQGICNTGKQPLLNLINNLSNNL